MHAQRLAWLATSYNSNRQKCKADPPLQTRLKNLQSDNPVSGNTLWTNEVMWEEKGLQNKWVISAFSQQLWYFLGEVS